MVTAFRQYAVFIGYAHEDSAAEFYYAFRYIDIFFFEYIIFIGTAT